MGQEGGVQKNERDILRRFLHSGSAFAGSGWGGTGIEETYEVEGSSRHDSGRGRTSRGIGLRREGVWMLDTLREIHGGKLLSSEDIPEASTDEEGDNSRASLRKNGGHQCRGLEVPCILD